MIRDAPIILEIRFPKELIRIRKFNPRPADPEPNTASKKRLAAIVLDPLITSFGTEFGTMSALIEALCDRAVVNSPAAKYAMLTNIYRTAIVRSETVPAHRMVLIGFY